MEDAFSALKIMVALSWYIGVYVLPLAIIASVAIRLVTVRHSSIKSLLGAAVAAAPLGANAVLGLGWPMAALLAALALTLFSAVLLRSGNRGFGGTYWLIEVFTMFGALIYMMAGVSWVVG